MAGGTRSSKRSSSPSFKRKRRIKDRSSKRRKVGKGKSKKVSRRESPDSYSDDESFASASSVSYSSTDNDCSRSRSRIIKDTSKSRKKSSSTSRRRRKDSENIINESKGKRSKKRKDTDSKNKKMKKSIKKKLKREPSTTSSCRSLSCSTSGSNGHESAEKGVKRRGRSRRQLDEIRSWCGLRSRSRSRSPSGLDAGGDSSFLIEEQHPRRLKSIIIFAKDFEEEDTEVLDRVVHKEEIVHDKDDYLFSRSNDSNGGGDMLIDASNGQTGYFDDQHVEMVGSEISIPEVSERCDTGVLERDLNASTFEGREPNVGSANSVSSTSDLEAVLRQKALENLKKFKVRENAKKPAHTKASYDGEMKQSLGLNADSELLNNDQESIFLSLPHQNMCAMHEGKADDDRMEVGEIEAKDLNEGNLGAVNFVDQAISKHEKPVLNSPIAESLLLSDYVDDVKDKDEKGESILKQCHGSSNTVDFHMIPIQESPMPKAVPSQSKGVAESMQLPHDAEKAADDVEKTSEISTLHTSNLEGQSSNAKESEDGDSQFQQKTMSVMRGGEMVQVSYKVYIPKHVPAVARRKLKR